jgi:hypothetical protein
MDTGIKSSKSMVTPKVNEVFRVFESRITASEHLRSNNIKNIIMLVADLLFINRRHLLNYIFFLQRLCEMHTAAENCLRF